MGVEYNSTDDCREDFSDGIVEAAEGRDGGAPGPKDGMAVGMLLVLGFKCANDSREGAGGCNGLDRDPVPGIPYELSIRTRVRPAPHLAATQGRNTSPAPRVNIP